MTCQTSQGAWCLWHGLASGLHAVPKSHSRALNVPECLIRLLIVSDFYCALCMPIKVLEEASPSKPMTPQRLVVSGGLTGFGVAQDLLLLDFSAPDQAPQEFRTTQYDATQISTPRPGVSGARPIPICTLHRQTPCACTCMQPLEVSCAPSL